MPSPMPPSATYRLQFNAAFTFDDATAIVTYLAALGISHVYASNYLKAVPGSPHGYDVADPTRLNPEIGDMRRYTEWVEALRASGMGHIIDLVPNHMGIAKSANPWWQDVLENGPSSRYAPVFDIDWKPLKQELEYKVLLPILGASYGAVLEQQELKLEYEGGAFRVRYYDQWLPIAPGTYNRILGAAADRLLADIGADSDAGIEFQSIVTAVNHLPGRAAQDPQLLAERDREKEVIKRRLAALTAASPPVLAHVERAVARFNGVRGNPGSFDALDELLSAQAYRLAYWQVAGEEINYRRFFDINELAAIRMESPAVFDLAHGFVFALLRDGFIDGFRVDHVDGLYDPGDYLARLQARAQEVRPDLYSSANPLFVVVEKILGIGEPLPSWPVAGTTGYEFLVMLNGAFLDQRNEQAIDDVYERFTRMRMPFREIAYRGKQLILRMSMASELNVLAHRLNRFSERNRHYRDFTLNSLGQAMREIIACFPVYRTYVNAREPDVSTHDREYIERAVRIAKRRNPNRPAPVYDFVRDLLLKKADYIPQTERDEHMNLVSRFQQVTSPVTAKGIEDTALYIYNRLVSLNEVGGEPDHFGTAPEALHRWLAERAAKWPRTLSTTSTHDTKRSEDVRARINVLSEVPGAWRQAITRWARANRRGRSTIDGQSYPSRNEEYLLYQTLIGSWPLGPMDDEQERAYRERILAYMQKAMREAKVFTSWLNPSAPHEQAMAQFIETVLARDNTAFRDDFLEFQSRIAQYGIYNSLGQLAVKMAAPGIPDFYQGTELWDFSLVDPDNRRPVDYLRRGALLTELDEALAGGGRAELAGQLMESVRDDRVKLYTTTTMLRFRRDHRALFDSGDYAPLGFEGLRHQHLFGFRRRLGSQQAALVVPRLVASLLPDAGAQPLGERIWVDTRIHVDDDAPPHYGNAFTGECVTVRRDDGHPFVRAADVFARFPVALLHTQ
jgi:(1->4)-alpha-D-glucan 1-alpha-D-glucosylmutase